MIGILELLSLALAATAAVFVMVLAARRLQLVRGVRRAEAAERRLRPLALGVVDGDDPGELSDADAAVLAALLARYARRLSGEPRDHVARFFDGSPHAERQFRLLRSRRAWRRAAAAFTLGDMGVRAAVPHLVAALADRDRDVRAAAARSLGVLAPLAGVEPLVTALASASVPRAVAGGALLRIGAGAVEPLLALAGSHDDRVRAAAIELVGLVGDAGDAHRFEQGLRDSAAEVRAKTARALGRVGAADASLALRGALSDRIPDVRVAAATALGDIGDRAAVVPLWRQASGDRHEPAAAAARALARIDARLVRELAGDGAAGAHLAAAGDLAGVGERP